MNRYHLAEHPELLEEFMRAVWWPRGREVTISAGFAGHDREIVVNIDGYDHPFERPVPEQVSEGLAYHLPGWKIENRGTRIECHPSGGFAGGYKPEDVTTLAEALPKLGLVVGETFDRQGGEHE